MWACGLQDVASPVIQARGDKKIHALEARGVDFVNFFNCLKIMEREPSWLGWCR